MILRSRKSIDNLSALRQLAITLGIETRATMRQLSVICVQH